MFAAQIWGARFAGGSHSHEGVRVRVIERLSLAGGGACKLLREAMWVSRMVVGYGCSSDTSRAYREAQGNHQSCLKNFDRGGGRCVGHSALVFSLQTTRLKHAPTSK